MSLAQQILLHVPAFLLGFLMVGSAIGLSIVGLLIVRHFIPHHKLKPHNDVAGPIFSTFGVVYAVLLTFMVVAVWDSFENSDSNVKKEADCLVALYRDAGPLLNTFRNRARTLFKEYGQVLIDEEWQVLKEGRSSPKADKLLEVIWQLYGSYKIANTTEEAFFTESVRRLNELNDLRLSRVIDSKKGIHPILWLVLVVGGLATISFTFFFGSENFSAQVIMSVLLAILISLILFTIFVLDFPFTGDIRISPEAFRQVLI